MRLDLGYLIFSVLLTFIKLQNVKAESSYCYSKREEDSCSRDKTTFDIELPKTEMAGPNALAVVPYNEDSILPLNKPKRIFEFAKNVITIQQDWNNRGVAAVVWDAAIVLCQYLEHHPDIVRERSVIEIGAGTGLVGIVATLLGGKVTVTDREEVLEVLQNAVDTNIDSESRTRIGVQALDWTRDLHKFEETFDVILGADVVYIEEVFDDLLKTLIKLSSKDTLILLSCRIRYDRDTNFMSMLEAFFTVKQILYDHTTDVKVFEVKKL